MNSNCVLAFTEVMTWQNEAELCSVTFCTAMMIHCWFHEYWDRYHCRKNIISLSTLLNFISFVPFTSFTNLCTFVGKLVCVCVCVCVSVYLVLLSHFLPFKIHLTNISPILIKMVGFKTLAWATSFATRASGKFIYLPYRASGEKSYCHTLDRKNC